MKKLLAVFVLCSFEMVSNRASAEGMAGSTESHAIDLEHSDAKPNKLLLERAKTILDKALLQLTGSSARGLGCTDVSSAVSKDEMAALVKKKRVRIVYVRSHEEGEVHQNSLLIGFTGYEIAGSRKKSPVVLALSVHYEKGSCAALGLRVMYDEPTQRKANS